MKNKVELKQSKQYKQALHAETRYITVNITLAVRFNLSPVELLVYSIIKHATDTLDLHLYSGSVKGICAKINVSLPTVRAALDKLVNKGFLIKGTMRRERQRPGAGQSLEETWVYYKAYDLFNKNDPRTPEEILEANQARLETMKQTKKNQEEGLYGTKSAAI